jgi:hypothetical protein
MAAPPDPPQGQHWRGLHDQDHGRDRGDDHRGDRRDAPRDGNRDDHANGDRVPRWQNPYVPQGYFAPPPVYYNEPGLSFYFPFH